MNASRPGHLACVALVLMTLLPALATAQDQPVQTPPVQAPPVTAQPVAAPPPASHKEWAANRRWLGAGLSMSFPYAEFGDDYSTGYGVHALLDKPVWPLVDLSGDIGITHFSGNEKHDSADIWNLLVGGRFAFGAFFIGAEGGWLSEVDDLGWVPSTGLRFEKLEFTLRWVTSGPDAWTTLRAGYYF